MQAREHLDAIKALYPQAEKNMRLDILRAVEMLGSEADVPFLQASLRPGDQDLNLAGTRALLAVLKDRSAYFTPERIQAFGLQPLLQHLTDPRIHV